MIDSLHQLRGRARVRCLPGGSAMRLLVLCPKCKRQYDASRRRVGSRFRCHCGRILKIKQPQGHEAAVVRCSSCGAPRRKHSSSCQFCQSDFTLHERDLDTVCPNCLARVSDKARFCHHCGLGLVPELDAGDETELCCPACPEEGTLVSRRLSGEKVAVLECSQCGGFWLGRETFRLLAERAKEQAAPPLNRIRLAPQQVAGVDAPARKQQGPFYRPCPFCKELMCRKNYGETSGVII